ncbi:MAG: DUF1232 domain-containing protein [Fimbriimonadaceae bacterium]|nr:DUF1232 domain-containing protein [Fimbriimonadaceae bacterium]
MRVLPNLTRLIRALGDPRVPVWIKILPFLTLIYVLSPLDFLPDPIIILGWIDDITIAFVLVGKAIQGLDQHQSRALLQRKA